MKCRWLMMTAACEDTRRGWRRAAKNCLHMHYLKKCKYRVHPRVPLSMHVIRHRSCMGEPMPAILASEGWTKKQYYKVSHGQVRRIDRYWPFEQMIEDYHRIGFDGLRRERGVNNTTVKRWLLYFGVTIRKHGETITKRESKPRIKLKHRGTAPSCADALDELSMYPRVTRHGAFVATVKRWRSHDMWKMYEAGSTYDEVADHFGVGFKTAYDALLHRPSRTPGGRRQWTLLHEGRRERLAYIRSCAAYGAWRKKVLQAQPCCVWCDARKNLQVDHIRPFISIVEEYNLDTCDEDALATKLANATRLWDVRNGRTLCATCHKQTRTYGCGALSWRPGHRQTQLL